MTSIQDLPREILCLIAENLDYYDLLQLQYVCHALYARVHGLILRDIGLSSALQVQKFIRSIDCNQDSSYLSAVKSIKFKYAYNENALSEENIRKLLFRFPNLEQVVLLESLKALENFNDSLCTEFLECCPKLNTFEELTLEQFNRSQLLLKVSQLITYTSMYTIQQFGGVHNGIRYFPRLRRIAGQSDQLLNMKDWLPIIKEVPRLEWLEIWGPGGEEDGFAEDYLATLSTSEQDCLLNTLSNLQNLNLTYTAGFTKNSAEFVKKYLTNSKKTIYLMIVFENDLDASTQLEVCKNSFDLVETAKSRTIYFNSLTFASASNCLNTVLERAFNPECTYRYLEIRMMDINTPTDISYYVLENYVTVVVRTNNLDILIGLNPITVDDCRLLICDNSRTIDTDRYLQILKDIPSIKSVMLHTFQDSEIEQIRFFNL